MLPEWMKKEDNYVPPGDGGTFVMKTIAGIGNSMARLKVQAGHEKRRHLPAEVKLVLAVLSILLISLCRNRIVLMAAAALLLVYLASWPARDLWGIMKNGLLAGGIALVLFLPAMWMRPEGRGNAIMVVAKVFLCAALISIFNHTTQWNHITSALRRFHVPGIFVFTLDITLKYIVLLGNLIVDLLTSVRLRAVGKFDKKYASIGGIMGVTFLRGTEMNEEMYEAMRCRGFTDDYKGL